MLLQSLARLLHLKPDENIAGVLGKTVDVLLQGVPGIIGPKAIESEIGDVVERLFRRGTIHVVFCTPVTGVLRVCLTNGFTGRFKGALQPPQKGERQNYFIVVGTLDNITDIVGDVPYILDVFKGGFRFVWPIFVTKLFPYSY